MPVFDQGYQALDAPVAPRALRWWPVWRQVVWPQLQRRIVLVLLALACSKVGVNALIIVLRQRARASNPLFRLPEFDSLAALQFISGTNLYGGQWLWIALVGALVGGGLIGRDLQTGALRLYLSRPLSRLDYCLGKVGGLALFVGAVAVGPALLLVGFHAAATGTWTHVDLSGPTLPALLAVGALWTLLASLTIAALSAVLQSPRQAGLAWIGYLALGDLLARRLAASWPGEEWPQCLSMTRVITSLGERMLLDAGVEVSFRPAPLSYDTIALWTACVVAITCGALWIRLSEVRR